MTIEGVSAGADVTVHPALQVMAMKSMASAANIQKSSNSVGRMVCQYVEEVEEQGEQGSTTDRFNFGHMKGRMDMEGSTEFQSDSRRVDNSMKKGPIK